MTPTSPSGHGRCTALTQDQVTLENLEGVQKLAFLSISGPAPGVGDLVEVFNGVLRLLTPNRSQNRTTHWMSQILHPRRIRNLRIRSGIEALIREFFTRRDFLETRTPLMVPSPGMEPHIRPFEVKTRGDSPVYLPTSPEFAMKRLLVGGLERIFQICPAFRDEPRSITHHPEFTMLEWYRAYSGYEQIMRDTEELFSFIATQLHGEPAIPYQGRKISVEPPWPRLQVRDLFLEHAGVDLVRAASTEALAAECRRLGLGAERAAAASATQETWDDLYFKIWLNLIEPRLPAKQAVFVTRYPASQAALSVIDQDSDGSFWARRFEAYAGGLELGNAFEELTDPKEQRSRFLKDMDLREAVYGADFPRSPIDEGFLEALEEGMPPSGGIAMGVDRIVMLMADEPEIEETIWLPSRSEHDSRE